MTRKARLWGDFFQERTKETPLAATGVVSVCLRPPRDPARLLSVSLSLICGIVVGKMWVCVGTTLCAAPMRYGHQASAPSVGPKIDHLIVMD